MTYKSQLTKELLESVLQEQYETFLAKDLGVAREILGGLKAVIEAPYITVITGLRRVGKSTLLAQIAHTYLPQGFYFVNFEDERLLNFTVEDFDLLHETLISMFGERQTFLFDEIQNIPEWERFVRRLHDQGYKFIVTGSNASLLSQELSTRLTGRSTRIELFPFSFLEFLAFKGQRATNTRSLTTKQRGHILALLNEYITKGGIPDSLKYPELDIHKTLYDDVLYRDIATRYQLENTKSLKELAFYLMSNVSTLISFNKLKELLKLGSVNTVKSYIDYLESSWLFLIVNKYAFSVKEQQIAAKKVYSIDTGLASSIGFSFSENKGKSMENIVFLHLKRALRDIYYYKTDSGHEIDFFLPELNTFIQVTRQLENDSVENREKRALFEVAKEQKDSKLLIITETEKRMIREGDAEIEVIPLHEFLTTVTL